ncbi:MAG: hypothetical protein [Bacteriophage sp.]|nr:MAG: hypothetical protein [Bacteriophage sp.]
MDYSKLSDFEINCEVLAVFSPDINHMCLSGDNSCFYDCGPTGDRWYQIDIPDYCNNPTEAWPIIVGNGISLNSRCANGEWKAQLHLGRDDIFDSYASCWDINPLKAAMIVFLMMQDH